MKNEQIGVSRQSTKVDRATSDQRHSTQLENQCPECEGTLVRAGDTDETVCSECGLIVAEHAIDHGPEWRTFDFEQGETASRVGLPTTQQMHDKGLTTNIGWRDQDAHGNPLSARQRQKMSRLRTWDERF